MVSPLGPLAAKAATAGYGAMYDNGRPDACYRFEKIANNRVLESNSSLKLVIKETDDYIELYSGSRISRIFLG